MTLSKNDLQRIIEAVTKDAESMGRIDSNLDGILPDSLGMAGNTRNAGYVLMNTLTGGYAADPSDPEYANRVCTGIANATSETIQRQIDQGAKGFENLASATTIDRVVNGTDHTATQVTTKDGQVHVLDWHQTLNADNPMVYQDAEVWKRGDSGETAEKVMKSAPAAGSGPGSAPPAGEGFADPLASIRQHLDKLSGNLSG
jgi:hypothetical protein